MPIIVKDYTWSQTSGVVHIRIPLNPVNHEKVDLFPTNKYIKAHFSPFLFEVFLLYDVDIKNSKCLVKEDLIYLDLVKIDQIEWECLEKELTKEEKMAIKQEVIQKCQEEAKQQSEDRQIKKSQLDRFAVQQAMEIDTKQHSIMDSRRDNVRKEAMDALEEWRVTNTVDGYKKQITGKPKNESNKEKYRLGSQREQNGVEITELPPSDDEDKKDSIKSNEAKDNINKKINAPIKKPSVKKPIKSEYVECKKEQAAKRVLPRLRQTTNLEITHTPRSFPTPSRESQAEEEQAWLKNITLARRATGKIISYL